LTPRRKFLNAASIRPLTDKLEGVLARRMLLFAAVLLLLATLAAGIAPRPPLPPPPPSSLPADPRTDGTVERVISADGARRASISVRRGEILRLQVSGKLLDSVLLDGLDQMEAVEPLTPARFELLAERAGTYPIRLVEADRQIGRIVITP
jgi:hypothetical protein